MDIRVRSAWQTQGTTSLYASNGGAFALAASGGSTTPAIPVGSKVYWSHTLNVFGTVKAGDTNAPYTIGYYKKRTGPGTFNETSATENWKIGGGGITYVSSTSSPDSDLTKSIDGIGSAASSYTVTSADVGQVFCENLSWKPRSLANQVLNQTELSSAPQCFKVSLDYNLTPNVTVNPSTVSYGSQATFSYSVANVSGTSTYPTSWKARNIVIPAGTAIPAAFGSSHDGISCSFYTAYAGITCSDGLSGSGVTINSGETKTVGADNVPAESYPVGTTICRVLSVWSYDASQDAAKTRDSKISCTLIAASPYVVVNGGTVWAGGSTDAATGYAGTANIRAASLSSSFGSFGEYGVFATGTVNYFGSAGRLGKGSTTSGMQDGTKLTFANTPSLGKFSTVHKITNLVTYYQDSAHTASVLDAGGGVVASGVYKASGDVTLSGITGKPKAVIYAPNNTVTIAGDIAYDTSGAVTFKDLPSLTVIAKTIVVNGNVSQIAGNFYAADRFVTCAGGPQTAGASPAITTTGACSQQLTINGALTVANSTVPGNNNALVLNRSYGGTEPNKAAEIIRMRPEVFLTTYENATSALLLTTVRETELPSRY